MIFIVLKIVKKVIGTLLGLAIGYLILTSVLGITFGIKTPQPFYNQQPYTTILTDPHAKKPYDKVVKPGDIQSLLDKYSYNQIYKVGVFDCSDMSREDAKYLESQGYHTSVIGDDDHEHAWVFVWTSQNSAWAIETTVVSELKNGSGEVVGDDWYDFHFVLDSLLNKNIFESYYPTINRNGLHVIDWSDPQLNYR